MPEKKILKIFSFSSSDGWTHGEILEFQKNHLNSDWLLFNFSSSSINCPSCANTFKAAF